jgi:KDO2-lipid IV(A) lauroyltransferase
LDQESVPLYRFLAPRFWPLWLGLGVIRVLTWLPLAGQRAAGWVIGRVAYWLARERRRIALINIGLCFPELDDSQRRTLARRHFDSLGMSLIETGMCWWASDRRVRNRVTYTGLEHLEAAMADGRGAILLTGHFTTLDLGGRFMTLVAPVAAMYRRADNPLLEEVMRRGRTRAADAVVPKQDVRGTLRHLKANRAIWYAPDQSHRRQNSAVVPFFGVPAATNTATSKFARLARAPVVPFYPVRLPGSAGYRLDILPALEDFPSDDPQADTARINALLESRVRLCPEQYLWVHKRFKPPTPGHVDPYAAPPT